MFSTNSTPLLAELQVDPARATHACKTSILNGCTSRPRAVGQHACFASEACASLQTMISATVTSAAAIWHANNENTPWKSNELSSVL